METHKSQYKQGFQLIEPEPKDLSEYSEKLPYRLQDVADLCELIQDEAHVDWFTTRPEDLARALLEAGYRKVGA